MTNTQSTRFEASSVLIILPVYKSEATLDELTVDINTILAPVVQCLEIIFVNDGSKDRSWAVITGLTQQNPNILGLNPMYNYGQHNVPLFGI